MSSPVAKKSWYENENQNRVVCYQQHFSREHDRQKRAFILLVYTVNIPVVKDTVSVLGK